ncbi:hypothetical protein FRC01_001069 [Tulasnella sp. 417]|nr:hypothetical protein FRC01_001069 [Tulasnella sp. 417]
MVEQSVLKPVDASTLPDYEAEGKAPWIVRELAGHQSLTGRVMMASYETIKATGKSVVCLSPVRVLLVTRLFGAKGEMLMGPVVTTSITLGTGGTAAIVAPAISPASDMLPGGSDAASFVTAQLISSAGKEVIDNAANWLLVDKPLDDLLRDHAHTLDGNSAKEVLITLKYKHVTKDAALGFFRSPQHEDASILSKVADYFAVENGWFSPYLFASGRRPVIPRSIQADVVFAHGPFLSGDYKVAETLLTQSAVALHFCQPPASPGEQESSLQDAVGANEQDAPESKATGLKAQTKRFGKRLFNKDAGSAVPTGGSDSAGRKLAVQANIPPADVDRTDLDPLAESSASTSGSVPPRRMVVLALGIKPHRAGAWTSSARPGESVMHYVLFSGCPAIVVPVKPGSPLVAWHTSTVSQLEKYGRDGKGDVEGVVRILLEYVELCVDWERIVAGSKERNGARAGEENELKREAAKDALTLLVEHLVQDIKEEVDRDRAGIVFFRLP